MENLRQAWDQASDREKLDFLKWAIEHRPNAYMNLARQLGFENTGKAFDLNLASQSIKDDRWRSVLCQAEYVLLEVKGQPAASETENVFVENWCRGRPSGIAVSESEWFVLPLDGPEFQEEVAIVIATDRLKHIASGCHHTSGGDNGVASGYIVPIRKLVQPKRKADKPVSMTLF